jgi:short-subunit dehydrogenase
LERSLFQRLAAETMLYLMLAVGIAAVAIFFMSDCDPLLNLLPYDLTTDNSYKGQTVWITGASSGIGAQLALDFCSLHANVVISARRESSLQSVAQECRSKGQGQVMVMPLDVTDKQAQRVVYEAILKKFDKVDILVLNAGRSQRAGALDTSLEDSKSLLNLNVISYMAMTKLVVPQMLIGNDDNDNGDQDHKGGTVMVVSSVAGKIPATLSSTYSATKVRSYHQLPLDDD